MVERPRSASVLAATVIALTVLPSGLGCDRVGELLGIIEQPHPADHEMIANFQGHRAEFDHVRDMILHDAGLLRVDDHETWPKNPQVVGVTPERIAEYRLLLKRLGLRGGISSSEDGTTIELTNSTRGFVTHGSEKGYVYSRNPDPRFVVPELDSLSKRGAGNGWKHIEDNWYLYFEGS